MAFVTVKLRCPLSLCSCCLCRACRSSGLRCVGRCKRCRHSWFQLSFERASQGGCSCWCLQCSTACPLCCGSLKKGGEGRVGVSSRSAALKIYACLMQRKRNQSRKNALFCCLEYWPRTQRVGRLRKCKAVGNNGKGN